MATNFENKLNGMAKIHEMTGDQFEELMRIFGMLMAKNEMLHLVIKDSIVDQMLTDETCFVYIKLNELVPKLNLNLVLYPENIVEAFRSFSENDVAIYEGKNTYVFTDLNVSLEIERGFGDMEMWPHEHGDLEYTGTNFDAKRLCRYVGKEDILSFFVMSQEVDGKIDRMIKAVRTLEKGILCLDQSCYQELTTGTDFEIFSNDSFVCMDVYKNVEFILIEFDDERWARVDWSVNLATPIWCYHLLT